MGPEVKIDLICINLLESRQGQKRKLCNVLESSGTGRRPVPGLYNCSTMGYNRNKPGRFAQALYHRCPAFCAAGYLPTAVLAQTLPHCTTHLGESADTGRRSSKEMGSPADSPSPFDLGYTRRQPERRVVASRAASPGKTTGLVSIIEQLYRSDAGRRPVPDSRRYTVVAPFLISSTTSRRGHRGIQGGIDA